MRLIAVAVPVPRSTRSPTACPTRLPCRPVGARVLVPLGNRVLTGIVLGIVEAEAAAMGEVSDPPNSDSEVSSPRPESRSRVPDPESRRRRFHDQTPHRRSGFRSLPPADVVRLAAWVADYYACGVGEALAPRCRRGRGSRASGTRRLPRRARRGCSSERGVRRDVLEQLTGGKPVRVGAIGAASGAASHAVLLAPRARRPGHASRSR